jgi:DNA-binding CsgD family transcriptional regulator
MLAAVDGDLNGARAAFTDALHVHQHTSGPFELGRTLLAFGTVLRRAKRRQEARDVLVRAHKTFDALDARLWVIAAGNEMRRIGGRSPSGAKLTPTEQKVAELVATGRTNKQVAAALSLTVHTVEANLTRVYHKLGVRSRTELALRLVVVGHNDGG